MPVNTSKRIYWAMEAAGFAANGSSSFSAIKGLQSVAVTTTFNLTQVYEIGQLSLYDNYETIPEVEVSLECVIDGTPLMWNMATPTAANATLPAKLNDQCIFGLSIFGDTVSSASGTPNTQMVCSGMFVSSVGFTFPVEGEARETLSLIGSHKQWLTSGFTFTGNLFTNNDTPPSGIALRQHFVWGSGTGRSQIPGGGTGGIPNIAPDGYNNLRADGSKYNASVQNISVSADFNREALLELGRKNPFFRYASFPVEVNCDIEVLSTDGDLVDAPDNQNALSNKPIVLFLTNGMKIDLGTKNKLTSVQMGGADAGGGNMTCTYSYVNYNDLIITAPF